MKLEDFSSIFGVIKTFSDEQACIDHLEGIRWNGNVVSPFDASSKVYKCKGNKYRCKNTGKYFNVRTGTMFDNSKVSLQKWFLAMYLMTSHKKGISSIQLAKDIDVTQKTAWFVLQRIRNCFGIEMVGKLTSEVEIDETYIGGNAKNKHKKERQERIKKGTGYVHMTPVFGMLDRENKKVYAKIVTNPADGKVLKPIIRANVDEGSTIITDGYGGYYGLHKDFAQHIVVNHKNDNFATGGFHTNTLEGFWSLLKRGIYGIYHSASPKHLQKYVDEFSFRYNTREMTEGGRMNVLLGQSVKRLTYKKLTHG